MNRELAIELHLERNPLKPDPTLMAAGMRGDPWRVIIAAIIEGSDAEPGTKQRRLKGARAALACVLEHCPTPALLAKTDLFELAHVFMEAQLNDCGRMARQMVEMSNLWVAREGWLTTYDLPGVGKRVAGLIEEYCK